MILARVRRTLVERGLIEPRTHVLAACSGGPDSGALLVALAKLRAELDFELSAASVDHGLRPTAAADVEIAAAQAQQLGVAFHRLRVHVPAGQSLQQAARTQRYEALLALAKNLGAARVAVGHTQEDQAETLLMRLLHGAGLRGLSSIEPLRADGVMRPLIDCSRAAVLAYAKAHCSQLALDPSNDDMQFERVRVRQALLPLLQREDPAAVEHLCDLADDARSLSRTLDWAAENVFAISIQASGKIDVSSWLSVPEAVRRRALARWLERAGAQAPGRAHLEQLDRAISAPAEVWLPGGLTVESRGDGLLTLKR